MRSRFSAYVVGDGDYLMRTWHPRARPPQIDVDLDAAAYHLEIVATSGGRPGDESGVVEFVAQIGADVIRERSSFTRRAGRWMYVDGVLDG
ncbi:SEC-C motif-containing protein [Antricoccus suffuscus]|uniref:SEC-C motif-containing protein n=2 Tax=Antricoccus suffuscus TaxID=1629062 RepID=A0A2T1A2C4_9ACTN|nr:SEC-C motif-containing protein [Antricoccus suffuscus]